MLEIHYSIPDLPTGDGSRKWLYNLVRKIRMALKEATPVDKNVAKQSWSIVRRDEGGYSFGNVQPYSYFLEEGSVPGEKPWPNVGPRTQFHEGRIYSSQAPGGMVKKAEIEKVIDAAVKELERSFS